MKKFRKSNGETNRTSPFLVKMADGSQQVADYGIILFYAGGQFGSADLAGTKRKGDDITTHGLVMAACANLLGAQIQGRMSPLFQALIGTATTEAPSGDEEKSEGEASTPK